MLVYGSFNMEILSQNAININLSPATITSINKPVQYMSLSCLIVCVCVCVDCRWWNGQHVDGPDGLRF